MDEKVGVADATPKPATEQYEDGHSEEKVPLTKEDLVKIASISRACEERNLESIRSLAALPGGLINDELRRKAWPLLLGSESSDHDREAEWTKLKAHKDEEQVHLDVHRSFVYYPRDETDDEKNEHKHDLNNVITAVLRRHPMLHYFQGYHDIVQVLLLVLGARECVPSVERLSLLRIRDFLLPTMSGTEHHLRLLPSILNAADPDVFRHLSQTQPFFALAATLTLYAHDIEEYGDISRLFDFLLASEAVVSLYLFAVIVMSRKEELLAIEPDEPEMLHAILSKLPKPLDLEGLIRSTRKLFAEHPPETLPWRAWSKVSPNSVLKTTRDATALSHQSLEDGEHFFALESIELQRVEDWKRRQQNLQRLAKRYRRPIAYTGAAVMVAVFAVLARSLGNGQSAVIGLTNVAGRASSLLEKAISMISRRLASS